MLLHLLQPLPTVLTSLGDLNSLGSQSMSASSDKESVRAWFMAPVNYVSGMLGKKGVYGGV